MGADQQAGFIGTDLTGWRTPMRYLVSKGKQPRPLRLAPMDRTYRDAPAPGGGTPSVVARWSPSGQRIPITLKGPSELGESCEALSWFGTCRRTRSRP
jgi:hypothetical protein